jgi:hypothetical protein
MSRLLVAELKLLLRGRRWWWYAIAGGFVIAGLVKKPQVVRGYMLPFAWIWPIAVWSGLGCRERRAVRIFFVALWYPGPLNRVAALDFSGACSNGSLQLFLPLTALLLASAFWGRSRQVRQ